MTEIKRVIPGCEHTQDRMIEWNNNGACPICLTAAVLQARAKCSEMRDAIGSVCDLIDASQGVAGYHRNGDIAPWHELMAGGRYECLADLGHCLSSDSGRDYVPRRQLDETRKELERMKSQTGSCSVCGNTVWSQEDDRGIAHCIVCALSAERDSLRAALKECGQVLDDSSTAGIVYSPLVDRIKQALAKAKEALK